MINIMYAVDPIKRIVKSMSGHAVTEQDHEASSLRFAFPDNIAGTGLDSTGTAVRVMYIRPDGGDPVAKTLTFYKHSGGYYLYDWNLQKSDLQKEGRLVFSLCILNIAEGDVEEWHTTPCAVRVLSTIHTDDSDEGDDTITPTVKERVAVLESMIQRVASGAPIVVSSVSAMTDTEQIYVLTTDGKWYYHNGPAWVAGGVYGGVPTDTTLTQAGIPADAKVTGDKLNKKIDMPSGGAEGQLLEHDGDGGARWTTFGMPTDEQVGTALSDWLDDHPEATTTVQDGSLTESKFSDALKMSAINDHVTPEMFGAVGDGVTDDTQALQDMFDSGKNVFLPNKTYLTDGNTISNITHIVSNHATFKARSNLQSHLLYVNARIYLSGRIILNGDNKALNGILFDASGSSVIDVIDVSYCLVWGVYNITSPGIVINRITAYGCGTKLAASVSYASNTILNIDGDLTDKQKSVLASQYAFPAFLYDTRETASTAQVPCCVVSGYDSANNQFNKKPYGAFNNSSFSAVPCIVCIGGAAGIGEAIGGQTYIGMIGSTICATTLGMRTTYGQDIGRIYSQSDHVGIFTDKYHQGTRYGSLTFEGTKSGYLFATYLYDYSIINVRSTGYDENFSSKSLVCINGQNSSADVLPIIADFHLRKALPFYHVTTMTPTINENSPRNLFVRATKAFNLGLLDTYQSDASYNLWGIKTIYVMSPTVSTDHITITLKSSLVSEGYTIKNGVNGVLEFERPSQYFKIEIFMQRKEFIVFATPLNVVTNVST